MNKKKYKDSYYEMRPIRDLKQLVDESTLLYAKKTAYYIKNKPGGVYMPVLYEEFKRDLDGLGTALLNMGLQGKKIAIIGENSYEWVLSYCAVVNGTGVAVPLDRELRPKEIGNLLEQAEVSAIIYSRKSEQVLHEAVELSAQTPRLIAMEELRGLIAEGKTLLEGGDTRFVSAEIQQDAMCVLLFTSGTTGMAKGVMLSHRNIATNVFNLSKYVRIQEDGIGLSVLPMHHSYEMTCHILTSIYQGIAIAICEGLKYIAKNMAEIQATVMVGVPLLFESMHKKIWKQAEVSGKAKKLRKAIYVSKKFKLYNYPVLTRRMFRDIHKTTGGRVSLFIAGGAAINPRVIEDFEAMGFPMIQGYGMTENAPIIAVNRDQYSKAASVGCPVPGTEVRIINPDRKGMGQIICKGSSVMLGYYGKPEETEKVLIDGWLYTGDYGYFDEDGMLYITGRVKNVIVTKNGKNIFPEEVEFYLTERPYIMEALVHGINEVRTGDTVVKAEIFPDFERIQNDKGQISQAQLRELISREIDAANELMPIYKQVKRFGIRETEFIKTTTRKIKRYTAENFSEA